MKRRTLSATALHGTGQGGALSVLYQVKSSGTTPSTLRVIDFGLPA
jgi:hypothetical protein